STTTSGTAHQDRNRWMERKVVTDAEEVSPPVLARLCAHPATRPTAHPPTLADYVEYTSGGHPVGCPPEVCDCGWEIRAGNRARSLLLLGSLGGLFSGLGVGLDRSLLDDLSISLDDLGLSRCLFGLCRSLVCGRSGGSGRLFGFLHRRLLRRVGLEDQFDDGHGCVIPRARTDLGDPGVATGTLGHRLRDRGEELVHDRLVGDLSEHATACGQVPLLRVRDHPLGHRAQALGLGHGRFDLLVLEQLGSHVVEHETLVCGRSAEARALGWGWHCQLLLGLNQYCSSST